MIPQVKLSFGDEEKAAVQRVMDSGWITEGKECEAFRNELLEVIGAPYGVFAPNGTLALVLGLMALGIGTGDKVIVPDSTFIASANAVLMVGATPVFCDVGEDFQFSVANAERVMDEDVKAIMPVHLYGSSPDMPEVYLFAQEHKLLVVEDAAQGMGLYNYECHAGALGNVGCFSFYADKTITTGEGGFVICNDYETYSRLLLYRNHGRPNSGTFIHPSIGYNFRITDLQAAIGRVQLTKLDWIVERKREIYSWYMNDLPLYQVIPVLPESAVPFRAVFLCEDAKFLAGALAANDIEPRTAFYPLHNQPCFEYLMQRGSFLNAWRLWDHGVCLPVYPSLTRSEVTYITDTIKAFYA